MVVTEGETDCEPLAAVLEVQGAEQEVALVEDQVSADDWPIKMEEGVAVSEIVGGGGRVFATAIAEYPLKLTALSAARTR